MILPSQREVGMCKMPNVVVFDCESDGKPDRTGTYGAPDFRHVECTVACALVIDATTLAITETVDAALRDAKRITAWRDVVPRKGAGPFDELFEAFDNADIIVGFNQLDFDFPLLFKYYKRNWNREKYAQHRMKCLDVFQRVRSVLGFWPKLERLLLANGLQGKIGTGADAITLWEEGRRDELAHYCEVDVLRTAQLALLSSMQVDVQTCIPGHVYGIAPALASMLVCRVQCDTQVATDLNCDDAHMMPGSPSQSS